MRKIIVPALAFLLAITVALVIYRSVLTERSPASHKAGRSTALGPSSSPGEPNALRGPHAKAAQLLQSGQLQEAQDVFLEILSLNPQDEAALRGLAVVRRYMAGDNPATLRRQAEAYWEAIRRGVENEEHYSLRAMETLLTATLQAVQEIEARKPPTHAPAGPAQAITPAAGAQPQNAVPPNGKPPFPPTPAPSPGPQTPVLPGGKASPPAAPPAKPVAPQAAAVPAAKPPTPVTTPAKPAASPPPAPSGTKALPPATNPARPSAPKTAIPSSAPATSSAAATQSSPPPAASGAKKAPLPASSSQTWATAAHPASAPPTEPSASVNNGQYMVRVGPVSDRDLASAIAKQLSAGGFSQTNVASRAGFRVVSEPLPLSAAEGLAASLASRGVHTQIEPLGRDVAHLVFGSFASRKDAEALSQGIAAQGYDAWIREETVYTLQLGPYPQSSVTTISGIVKSSAPGAAVSVDPMP